MFHGVSNLLFGSFQYFQCSARLDLFVQTVGFDQCNFWVVALLPCIQLTFIELGCKNFVIYLVCHLVGLILPCDIYLDIITKLQHVEV